VVAESGGAPRRPNQRAIDPRLDFLEMPVGPGHAKRGDEMRSSLRGLRRAALGEQPFDPAHRGVEILVRPGPARRLDPRRSLKRVDHQTRIVGKRGQFRRIGRRRRLDPGIRCKTVAGFFRLGETKLASRYCADAMRREQLAHLGELAWIMRGDHELAGDATMLGHGGLPNYPTAIFCRSTSFVTPFFASAISARNSSWEKGVFSAVPCTSMMRPSPVMTKLASVSADESSA